MTPATYRSRTATALGTWWSLLVVGALLVFGLAHNGAQSFDPGWLLVPLNLVFLTAVPLSVAWVSLSAYRSTGVAAVLAIGAGMLAVGLGGGAVPAVLRYIDGPNAQVTMHNGAVLIAAAAQVVAAVMTVVARPPRAAAGRTRDVAVLYTLFVAVLLVLLILVRTKTMPEFFRPGPGATTLRQIVLGAAAEMFAFTAIIWAATSFRMRAGFARWYSVGLALFAIGLTGVFFQHAVGNLLGWVGRGAQYAGAIYLLVAVLSLRERAGGAPERNMGMTLFQSAVRFQPLVESSAEAITVLGGERQVLYWNDAAARLFGYRDVEAFGEDLLDLVAPAGPSSAARTGVSRFLLGGGRPEERWVGDLIARTGSRFPAEMAIYEYVGGTERVCVIRDLTALRAAEADAAAARFELEAENERARERAQHERLAREVNDDIVQGLVAAEIAYDLGRGDESRRLLGETSRAARRWIGEQLRSAGRPQPGSLVRRRADRRCERADAGT